MDGPYNNLSFSFINLRATEYFLCMGEKRYINSPIFYILQRRFKFIKIFTRNILIFRKQRKLCLQTYNLGLNQCKPRTDITTFRSVHVAYTLTLKLHYLVLKWCKSIIYYLQAIRTGGTDLLNKKFFPVSRTQSTQTTYQTQNIFLSR